MRAAWSAVTALIILLVVACSAPAATFLPERPEDTRKLDVVRQYKVPAHKGQRLVVLVPVTMSFWGVTNRQVVLSSEFTWSIPPDQTTVETTRYHRYHRLTWNAPDADEVTITQKLVVEIGYSSTVSSRAGLPYPERITQAFTDSLKRTDFINPGNAEITEITLDIPKKAVYAIEAVEQVCDWVNDNIKYQTSSSNRSDDVLKTRLGNDAGMSNLVCAMLRNMGVPAEPVVARVIGGQEQDSLTFVEAYVPDTGWMFFDVAGRSRALHPLDVLMSVGNGYFYHDGAKWQYVNEYRCKETDAEAWEKPRRFVSKTRVRAMPRSAEVGGVRVIRQVPPADVKARHMPLRAEELDVTIPSEVREYVRQSVQGGKVHRENPTDEGPRGVALPSTSTSAQPPEKKPEKKPE